MKGNKIKNKKLTKQKQIDSELIITEEANSTENPKYLYYILMAFVILLAVLIVWQVDKHRTTQNIKTDIQVTVLPTGINDPTNPEGSLVLISPNPESVQTDEVRLIAEVKNISELTVMVVDNENKELFSENYKTKVEGTMILDKTITLTTSPTSQTGAVVIYSGKAVPNNEIVRVNVNFETVEN